LIQESGMPSDPPRDDAEDEPAPETEAIAEPVADPMSVEAADGDGGDTDADIAPEEPAENDTGLAAEAPATGPASHGAAPADSAPAGAASAPAGLPLGDRRALAAYQADILPGLLSEIRSAAGYALPVDVDWSSVAGRGDGPKYADPDYFTNVFFRPLAAALRGVAQDPMGREALAAGVRRVLIRHDPDTAPASAYANGLELEGGTLRINFTPWSNSADIDERVRAIQGFLEERL
jgi:hypothetical protein